VECRIVAGNGSEWSRGKIVRGGLGEGGFRSATIGAVPQGDGELG
jgi:hypothetical protein